MPHTCCWSSLRRTKSLSSRKPHENMEASSCIQEDASKEDVMAAQTKLHAAEEKIGHHGPYCGGIEQDDS